MDILEEARLAVLFQRALRGQFGELAAPAALFLATLGGAQALGIDREVGSLEPGKAADLAAFPLGMAGPVYDSQTAAVFALPGTHASFVAVAGEVLVRDGVLLRADPAVGRRVQQSADVLQSWLRTT